MINVWTKCFKPSNTILLHLYDSEFLGMDDTGQR